MNVTLFVIPILATALLLGCCQVSLAQSREPKLQHSMKGYELYSWKIRGEWYFALLVGTNRLKSRREVDSPKARVRGVEALKRKLSRLAEGEEVAWAGRLVPWAVLPPEKIVDEIKNYCDRRGITLRVSRRGVSDASNKRVHPTASQASFSSRTYAVSRLCARRVVPGIMLHTVESKASEEG